MSVESYLVVDANIARSYNDPASDDQAYLCFLFLQALSARDSRHGVVLNEALEAEWLKHGSGKFLRWFAMMETRQKVLRSSHPKSADYRNAMAAVTDDGIREALLKDAHLVELALMGNYPVASRDDKQRRYVASLLGVYERLGRIQWFNPVTESWESWLAAGCPTGDYTLEEFAA